MTSSFPDIRPFFAALLLLPGLLAAQAGAPAPAPASPALAHPDLSGQWRINIARSDDPQTMLSFDTTGAASRPQSSSGRGSGGRGSGGGGGFGGRGMGGMGGGRRGGGSGGGQPRGDAPPPLTESQRLGFRQALRLALSAPGRLPITQTDSTVSFGADTAPSLLHTDGRTITTPPLDSATEVHITARWLGNALLITRQVEGGGRVTEDYLKAADGAQITVIVHFDGGAGRSLDFRRVYDLLAP